MRVLLATDGSVAAAAARDLVATLPWPGGSAIEVVHALQLPTVAMASLGPAIGPTEATDLTALLEHEGQRILDDTVARVSGPGEICPPHLEVGRPAQVIADRAADSTSISWSPVTGGVRGSSRCSWARSRRRWSTGARRRCSWRAPSGHRSCCSPWMGPASARPP